MADSAEQRPKSLAEKLNHLFHTIHPPGRGEYSPEEVAEGIRAKGGPTISPSYIYLLRAGKRDNPTKRHLEALADFFDEEVAARIDAQLELLAALRDAGVREIALRASDLSPRSVDAIRQMIDHVREIEGATEREPARKEETA